MKWKHFDDSVVQPSDGSVKHCLTLSTMDASNSGEVKWTLSSSAVPKDAGPKYSRISEHFRHVTPGAFQCSMFCGGKQCKYENPAKMKKEEMAINGLYSSWVTQDILATARPSTEVIEKYQVIDQFKRNGIKSLINLQHPGEHSSCGFGLEPVSGFSYIPEHFMQEDIFFYNFGWNDYGVRSLESILDMVKVMSFALQEGKVAIHCHAGLGRTGVLIACYLVFSERLQADEAIHQVRSNRPKAVQTRGQIQCAVDFTNFLHHLWVVYPSCAPSAKKFTMQQYLKRQRNLLHGVESRVLKYIPKLVYLCCCRLLEVAGVKKEDVPFTWTLSREVKAVFEETDENDTISESAEEFVQPSISRDMVDAVKHNPYVDSDTPSFETSVMQRSQSWDAVQEVTLKGEIGYYSRGKHLNVEQLTNGRRGSEPAGSDQRAMSDGLPSNPSPRSVKLEPLNLSTRKKNKKKGKGGQRNSNETVNEMVNMDSFLSSLKQNTVQPGTSDRIQAAKCLSSSACADSSVHNRVERIKRKLNSSDSWEEVCTETDPWVLTRLLWTWLDNLAEPVLTNSEVSTLEENMNDPIGAVKKLGRGARDTLECLITTICELEPLPEELSEKVLRHTAMILTHNKELSLTQTRRRSEQSPDTNTQENRVGEVGDLSESSLCSSSYRLLRFLRQLMNALKRLGGLT